MACIDGQKFYIGTMPALSFYDEEESLTWYTREQGDDGLVRSHAALIEESKEGAAIDETHCWIDDFDSATEEDYVCSSKKESDDAMKKNEPGQYVTYAVNNDLDEFESDDDLEGGNGDPLISISNSGMPPIMVKTKKTGEQMDSIGSHVLFNTHGQLLLKHKNKLHGSTKEQNFLQRLVAAGEKQSVPLLFWEGSIFTDIFWADTTDQSIVGSLPTAFLADNKTLNANGCAGLRDQFQTRIQNPALATSMDH